MHLITGNTYAHRDALRALGCRWDAAAKAWSTADEGAAHKARAMAGLVVALASPATGVSPRYRRAAAQAAGAHPEALTRRGNCGFGPDDVAYDDI